MGCVLQNFETELQLVSHPDTSYIVGVKYHSVASAAVSNVKGVP
jgi:hypothetical protein